MRDGFKSAALLGSCALMAHPVSPNPIDHKTDERHDLRSVGETEAQGN
jgi:hypothetical protein